MRTQVLILALAVNAASAGLWGQLTPGSLRSKMTTFSPAEFAAEFQEAKALLESGKWAAAEKKLVPLAKKAPDDIEVQYALAQAYRLQGQLEKAEKTTQWLLDLRPDFAGGLWEAALLREQFQDLSGAVDLLNAVYHRTHASNPKQRAAVLEDLARIFDKQENKKDAEIVRKEILRLKGSIRENTDSNPL
jgi:predicted Zn-dependent protease